MSDQCKNCKLRGYIDDCRATECGHHENWVMIETHKELSSLRKENEELILQLSGRTMSYDPETWNKAVDKSLEVVMALYQLTGAEERDPHSEGCLDALHSVMQMIEKEKI